MNSYIRFYVFSALLCCVRAQGAPIGPPATATAGIYSASTENNLRTGSGGSCGFGPTGVTGYPDGAIASVNGSIPILSTAAERGCGACIQFTCIDARACTGGAAPIVLTVVDTASTNIPSSQFSKVANTADGSAAFQLQQVDCTPPNAIVIRVLSFRATSGGYVKLTHLSSAGIATVRSIEFKNTAAPASTFTAMTNTYGAVWEASNLPAFPLDLRLTDTLGHAVVAAGVITPTAHGDIQTNVQFPPSATSPVASPPPSPIPTPTPSPILVPVPVPVPVPTPVYIPVPVSTPVAAPALPVLLSPSPVLPPPAPVLPPAPAPALVLPAAVPVPAPVPVPVPVPPSPAPAVPSPAPPPILPPPAPVLPPPSPVLLAPVAAPIVSVVPSPPPVVPAPSPAPALAAPPPVVASPSPLPIVLPVPPAPAPIVAAPVPTPAPVAPAPAPSPPPVSPPPPPSPVVTPVPFVQAPGPPGCRTVEQILAANPNLTDWLANLQGLGQASALNNPLLNITMFAPVNSAFTAPLPPDNSVGAATVSDLFTKDPTVRSPVSGYHVVAGSYPSTLLTPGTTLPTVDVVRNAGRPDTPVTLQITAPGKIQGVGSAANITQADLRTCGASIVHIIDNVLLPFNPVTGPVPDG